MREDIASPPPPPPRSTIEVEANLEQLSRWMDSMFRLPILNWRFGLNAIIDLIPGVGDIATSIVALYLLASAVRYRVPKITLLRMGLNVAIYFIIGLLPYIGGVFGAWWKPNMRNITLLRRRATVSARDAHEARMSDWLFVGMIIVLLLALLFGSILLVYFALRYAARNQPFS